jgi:hypothetical protein
VYKPLADVQCETQELTSPIPNEQISRMCPAMQDYIGASQNMQVVTGMPVIATRDNLVGIKAKQGKIKID